MNTPNELQLMEENKKLKLELEKVNSSFKAKPEGFFSRILNTVDGVLSGFRSNREIDSSEINEATNSLETLRLASLELKNSISTGNLNNLNYKMEESPREEINDKPLCIDDLKTNSNKIKYSNFEQELINNSMVLSNLILKSTEKEDIGFVKIKSIEVEDLHEFLSKYDTNSNQSAAYQIPKSLRMALGRALKIPVNETILSYYKKSIGVNQQFILDLKKYILSKKDFDIEAAITTHALPKFGEYNLTKLYDMIAKCQKEISEFKYLISEKNNLQIKEAIISNIGPIPFLNYVTKKYKNLMISEYCSIDDMIEYLEIAMNDYSRMIREQKDLSNLTKNISINATEIPTKGIKNDIIKKDHEKKGDDDTSHGKHDKKDKPLPENKNKNVQWEKSCWNCGEAHKLIDCKSKCSVHDKYCDNYYNCLIEKYPDSQIYRKRVKEKINVICIDECGEKCTNIFDPGASATAAHKMDLFNEDSIEFKTIHSSVEVGNGATINIEGRGIIGDKEVYYVPSLNKTVIATDISLSDGRINILHGDDLVIIKNDPRIINKLKEINEIAAANDLFVVKLNREKGLYPMKDAEAKRLCQKDNTNDDDQSALFCAECFTENIEMNPTYFTIENSKSADEVNFWHKAFNHASKRKMISIVKNKIYKNIPSTLTVKKINKYFPKCISCFRGNMRAKPVPQESTRKYKIGEVCVGDTKHMTDPDIDGNTYMTTFTDRGSDKTFIYLHNRLDNLIDLIRDVCNQFKADGKCMKILCMDSQYKTKEIDEYLTRANLKFERIEQYLPAPYEHAQNGKAENLIQKIENDIIKVLDDSKAPKAFWGPIAQNIVKIRNSMNSNIELNQSRNELWGYKKGDLNVTPMIPFGSTVLAHVATKHQAPLDFKCFKTISMGWADGVKGGIVLRNLVTNKNIIRRTFKVLGPGSSSLYNPNYDANVLIEDFDDDEELINDAITENNSLPNKHDRIYEVLNRNSHIFSKKNSHYLNKIKSIFYDNEDKSYWKVTAVVKENKSSGTGSKTVYFKYYNLDKYPGGPTNDTNYEYTPCAEILRDKHITWDDVRNREGVKINTVISMGHELQIYRVDFKDMAENTPPTSINEARRHPEQGYFNAFLKEVDAFHRKGADIPAEIDIKDIDPKLILQLIPLFQKKFTGANFEKFKCRLVLLGNHWQNVQNIDTSASMIGIDTLKLLLAIAASLDLDMVKFDVKEAYLSTRVKANNKYYARRPPGTRNNEMAYIMEPECFIYGHPLANKEFRDLLVKKLLDMGAIISKFDPNLYYINNSLGKAFIPTIVDDMPTMYAGGDPMLKFLTDGLSEIFEITCENPLQTVLGMEISRDRLNKTITLKQRGAQYNLFNKHIPTWETDEIDTFSKIPKNPNGPLSNKNTKLKSELLNNKDKEIYQSIVGELNWITNTAPDFMYATRCSARAMVSPSKYDMKELMQIVSCMAGIVRRNKDGLTIGGQNIDLVFTTDTSYHGFTDLKSCTGGTMHLNHSTGSISSISEKHKLTADSAMAAEGIGAHIQIKRALPIIYLFEELGLDVAKAKFYMDNVPYMQTIIGDKGPSPKSKHMLIRLQVLKEAYEEGMIELLHLRSENMVADILTKALSYEKWNKLRDPLLGRSSIVINDLNDSILQLNTARFLFI